MCFFALHQWSATNYAAIIKFHQLRLGTAMKKLLVAATMIAAMSASAVAYADTTGTPAPNPGPTPVGGPAPSPTPQTPLQPLPQPKSNALNAL